LIFLYLPKGFRKKIAKECAEIDSRKFEYLLQIKEAESSIMTQLSSIHGEEVKLSSIFSLSSGKLLSKKNRIEGNIPVYGGNGVTGFHNQSFVDADTIVIGRVGEYCGSVHLTDKPAWITDNALYVREYKMDAVPKYILYALRRLNLNQYANRTGQPNISQSSIANVLMVMPSIADQVRIVKEIEKLEEQINEARSFIESSSAKKQEILDKYLK
jgi:type I restriction enzyme S subunit